MISSPPIFANKLDERKYQMEYLAAAFRVFSKQGFDEGVAGHISLRDSIYPRMYTLIMRETSRKSRNIYAYPKAL